ncbi:MAG TPA: HEPN domain-containing protein [Acidothermaceae bacterium]
MSEVRALRAHYPVRVGHLASGSLAVAAKAHGRACTVLLSSHFERYLYAVNEEAVDWLNANPYPLSALPEEIILLHSQDAIDDLGRTGWLKRATKLREFLLTDGPLWAPASSTGSLDHSRLLTWMKTPKPYEVLRFYRQYGIDDVFTSITRSKQARSELWLTINELVEKRNNIAHGDMQTESLPSSITTYTNVVVRFTESADKLLARNLRRRCGTLAAPW